MSERIPNIGSQIDRALRAYFVSKGATPQPGAANGGIFLTLETSERRNPLRTILAHDASESAAFTGNMTFDVTIVDQFDGIPQSGEYNPEQRRIEIDRQVGTMRYWMAQTDDNATLLLTAKGITDAGRALATAGSAQSKANNDDMGEFTCLFVELISMHRGHPQGGDGGIDETTWREVTKYKITACPAAIVGYSNTEGQ